MSLSIVLADNDRSTTGNGFTTKSFNTTGADLLIVELGTDPGGTGTAISDSKGNTWHALTQQSRANVAGRLYYAYNATVGTGHTITIAGTSNFPAVALLAVSGSLTTSDPFDVEAGSAQNAAAFPCGTLTPSLSGSLIVAGAGTSDAGVTPTVDSGFTVQTVDVGGTYGAQASAIATLVQTTAASVSPSFTFTGGVYGGGNLAAFKPAPTAPASTSAPVAEPSHLAAHITWTPPASNGGSVITGYLIEQRIGAGSWTTAATSGVVLEYLITGLTLADSMTFRVSAINSVGTATASSASNSVTIVDQTGYLLLKNGTDHWLTKAGDKYLRKAGAPSGGPTLISQAETGAGTDTQSLTGALAQTDTGTGTSSQTLAAVILQTDTGSGADAQSIVVLFTQADTGSGVDAQTIAGAIAQADTGSGLDAQALLGALNQTDTGSGADAQSLSGAVAQSDSGSGTDAQAILAGVTQVDTGAGADTQALTGVVPQSDSGTGANSQTITGTGVQADAGTGADGQSLMVFITQTDSGTGSDSETIQTSGGTTNITQSDTGTGADTQTLTGTLAQTDTGTGANAQSLAGTLATQTDSGSGADAQSINAGVTQSDVGTSVDTQSIVGAIPQSDSGTGANSQTMTGTSVQTDVGTGSSSEALTGILTLVEQGAGVDGQTILVHITQADTGSGTDSESIVVIVVPLTTPGTVTLRFDTPTVLIDFASPTAIVTFDPMTDALTFTQRTMTTMLSCDKDIYSIGDAPVITAAFLDIPIPPATVGALADPTTVIFKITNQATGTFVTFTSGVSSELTHPSIGVYVLAMPVLTVSGRYKVKVTGEGALAAVARGEFVVRAD